MNAFRITTPGLSNALHRQRLMTTNDPGPRNGPEQWLSLDAAGGEHWALHIRDRWRAPAGGQQHWSNTPFSVLGLPFGLDIGTSSKPSPALWCIVRSWCVNGLDFVKSKSASSWP